jgi:hypothetical protein
MDQLGDLLQLADYISPSNPHPLQNGIKLAVKFTIWQNVILADGITLQSAREDS